VTIEIGIAVTIALAILGAFATLVKMIRSADLRRIEVLEGQLSVLTTNSISHAALAQKVDTQGKLIDEDRAEIEKLKDQMTDCREGIAGMGAIYLPRKEYQDERHRK
jgi:hypothetical protein